MTQKHRARLQKLSRRLLPDGRPTSISVMGLAGDTVFATLQLATGEPTNLLWVAPCDAE